MYTDGQPHELGFFDPVYEDIAVTPENYQEEEAKGLWFYVAGIKILVGMRSIRFYYETDEGILLKSDTVPVLYYGPKGEPGEQGPRAPQYFGLFKPASPEEGDWYLDAATGYVQEYRSGAWHNLDYESNSSKYMAAINDAMGSLQLSDETLPMVKAMTAWINNLTANYAFIYKLFTKKITLQEGGIFKSSNYNGTANNRQRIENIPEGTKVVLDNNGTVGIAIDSDGHLDAVDMNATGGRFKNVAVEGSFVSTRGIRFQNSIYENDISVLELGRLLADLKEIIYDGVGDDTAKRLICKGQIRVKIGNIFYHVQFSSCNYHVFQVPTGATLQFNSYECYGGVVDGALVDSSFYINYSGIYYPMEGVKETASMTVTIGGTSYKTFNEIKFEFYF